MIKNVDIDQMYAKEKGTTKPKTKIESYINEEQTRQRIREKSLDIIEACALATTPETLENDAWQLAHTARTWMEIYINLDAIDGVRTIRMNDNGLL